MIPFFSLAGFLAGVSFSYLTFTPPPPSCLSRYAPSLPRSVAACGCGTLSCLLRLLIRFELGSLTFPPTPSLPCFFFRVPMACDTHAQQIADMALDMQV